MVVTQNSGLEAAQPGNFEIYHCIQVQYLLSLVTVKPFFTSLFQEFLNEPLTVERGKEHFVSFFVTAFGTSENRFIVHEVHVQKTSTHITSQLHSAELLSPF